MNPVVLITGALTGIGRATAVAFAKEGASIASGRREAEGTRHALDNDRSVDSGANGERLQALDDDLA